MLTHGCETFGLSALVLPKRTIGTYCGLRLEEEALALLLRQPDSAAGALRLAPVECNLPLLLTLPVQPGESSLAQLVQGAFTRRTLPPRRYVERLATLARQEEERFGTYSAPLLARLQADLDHKRREVTDLMGRDFLLHGFDVVDQAVGRLAEETAHLVSDRGSLALLQAQLETRLTSQGRELERVTQRLRTMVARLLTPLGSRRRRRALKLTQEVTLIKLTLSLCRVLWREESMFRDFMTYLDGQRSRLRAIRNGLMQRTPELARERHELAAHNDVSERAGRGLCLTEALGTHGHGLEDHYCHAALSPEALARDVAARLATEESAAVLAFLRAEALRQGHRAVESLSLLGTLSQLDPALRRKLLTACVQAAQVQIRIDAAVYAAREFLPVMTRVCVVPGGQDSPLAAWLREISAEPWEFVHRDITDCQHLGFEFLSFRFDNASISPAPQAVERFQNQVRQLIDATHRKGLAAVIERLNPLIRGWGEYFKIGQVSVLYQQLDIWLATQLGVPPGDARGLASLTAISERYQGRQMSRT